MTPDHLRDIEDRIKSVPNNVSTTVTAKPSKYTVAVARYLSYTRADLPLLVAEVRRLQAALEESRAHNQLSEDQVSALMVERDLALERGIRVGVEYAIEHWRIDSALGDEIDAACVEAQKQEAQERDASYASRAHELEVGADKDPLDTVKELRRLTVAVRELRVGDYIQILTPKTGVVVLTRVTDVDEIKGLRGIVRVEVEDLPYSIDYPNDALVITYRKDKP